MAEVLFLDGPLRGKVQDVPYGTFRWLAIEPPPVRVLFAEADEKPDMMLPNGITHEYRIKPNPYPFGPKSVAAIGDKVGERISVMQTVDASVFGCSREDVVRYIDRGARDRAEQMCREADENLTPGHFRRVWKGTKEQAWREFHSHRAGFKEPDPILEQALNTVMRSNEVWPNDDLVFFVYTAICEVLA